jgi:hypothetical protein
VSPDWFLSRKWERTEEPDEGNLHVRVCGEGAGQPAPLPGSGHSRCRACSAEGNVRSTNKYGENMKKLILTMILFITTSSAVFAAEPADILKLHDETVLKAKSIKEVLKYYTNERADKINGKLKRGGDADSDMLVSVKGGANDRKKGKTIKNQILSDKSAVIEVGLSEGDKYVIKFIKENGDWKINKISLKFNL